MENRILEKLDCIDKRFASVEKDIKVMKEDIGTLKEDVGILKEDVVTLKEDVGTLKEDVVTLKEDVGILKEDVVILKEDVGTLKEDVKITKTSTLFMEVDLCKKVDAIYESYTENTKKHEFYDKKLFNHDNAIDVHTWEINAIKNEISQ